MIGNMDPGVRDSIERSLDHNCPSPEQDLAQLSLLSSQLPDDAQGPRIRLLVVGLVDLVGQARWHLAAALYLLHEHSQALEAELLEGEDGRGMLSAGLEGVPASVWLVARAYGARMDRVVYSDMSENHFGTTAGAWILHMMIDSSLYRSLAALDRLAGILWVAAGLPLSEGGRDVRFYFRSRTVNRIHGALGSSDSARLVEIASGPLMKYATEYRDGFSHDFKVFSSLGGFRPTESRYRLSERQQKLEMARFDADGLFALGNATYHQVLLALEQSVTICRDAWPAEAAEVDAHA